MVPLIVLLVSWLVAGLAGVLTSGSWVRSWTDALRIGLAVMFVFTAVSHFHPRTRPDLVRMVPPQLPAAPWLVTITGILELAGAVGLLVPRWSGAAAFSLAALLVAMFPANAHAARAHLTVAGRAATSLWPRLALQVFWIALLCWVGQAFDSGTSDVGRINGESVVVGRHSQTRAP